jgi:hypothetical protein
MHTFLMDPYCMHSLMLKSTLPNDHPYIHMITSQTNNIHKSTLPNDHPYIHVITSQTNDIHKSIAHNVSGNHNRSKSIILINLNVGNIFDTYLNMYTRH